MIVEAPQSISLFILLLIIVFVLGCTFLSGVAVGIHRGFQHGLETGKGQTIAGEALLEGQKGQIVTLIHRIKELEDYIRAIES